MQPAFALRSALGSAGFERVPNLLCLSIPFVPSSVPRRTERLLLAVASPPTLAFAFLGTGSASTSPPSSALRWSASRGCKVHFMVRPVEIASPSPTRTFTFELSPPKSPPRDVEYHYAGKSANSRDRTFTGKTSSIMGCEPSSPSNAKKSEVDEATWFITRITQISWVGSKSPWASVLTGEFLAR